MAEALEAIERGEKRFLIINMPPRHGKSWLCGKIFPAWYLGRNPRKSIVLASYAASRADENSMLAKAFVESRDWPFDCKVSRKSSSVEEWRVLVDGVEAGGCKAIGVEGGITGFGAHVFLGDDCEHDGSSENEQVKTGEWFFEKIIPRLESFAAVIIIATRWGPTDLVGRILDSEWGPMFEVMRLPVYAEEVDLLGRKEGEVLCESMMPKSEVELRRVGMGAKAFAAQYLQDPIPDGGIVFQAPWLEHRYSGQLPEMQQVVQSIDSAWKDGPQNDWSVIATWGTDGKNFYLIDVWRDRVQFPILRRKVIEKYEEFSPHAVLVEDASSGTAVIQELQAGTNLPIIAVQPGRISKQAKAEAITPLFEAGKVMLPESAPWLDAWIEEHLRFPNAKNHHDDQVDTTSIALSRLSGYASSKPFGFSVNFARNQARW